VEEALIFNIAKRAGSYHQVAPQAPTGRYSVDGQTNKGVNYMWNVKDGEENLHYPGTRSDASQFMRQWVTWTYNQQHGPDIGLLADDVANEDALRRDVVKCRMRVGDESTQQWIYRFQVGTDLSAAYDILPLSEQPGVDADHYYLTSTVLPQVKAEYEEQHLIEEVTGQYDDTHHWLRNRLWFWPTRLMQIMKESNRSAATAGKMNSHGEIEKTETIAASLSRSAF